MALTTPNMGLISWDLSSDPYDHTQLAANFNTLDSHNHTAGSGAIITTPAIEDLAITTGKLAGSSVTTAKIADNSVTKAKMDRAYVHPLGSIMPWWRPSPLSAIPEGWVVAKGQTLTSSEHDFAGGGSITLPDLRNKFLLGADTEDTGTSTSTPPAISQAGGSHEKDTSHSHTIDPHSHDVDPHYHTVNEHSHTVPSHRHGLAEHRHAHFHALVNQVGGSWGYRIQNNYELDSVVAVDPTTGGTHVGTRPDVYSSGSLGTHTVYGGLENQAPQNSYAMIALERLENETPYLNVTTASRKYMRYITYSTAPCTPSGKEIKNTESTSVETDGRSPATDEAGLTANPNTTGLLANTGGATSLDVRPSFIGVLYLIKVKSNV